MTLDGALSSRSISRPLFTQEDLEMIDDNVVVNERLEMSNLPEQRKGIQINPEIRLDFVLSALIALFMGGYFLFTSGSKQESRYARVELQIDNLKLDQQRQDEQAREKDNRLWEKLNAMDGKLDRYLELRNRQ